MPTIRIQSADRRWKGKTALVRKAARVVLSSPRRRGSSASRLRCEILLGLDSRLRGNDNASLTILLTTDAEVRALNKQYRKKDKPTNVLSFPDGEADETGEVQLGDIALAYETIAREASEQGKEFEAHLVHLVIHGVLHLLGYDHEEEADAEIMEALEVRLLERMGIANPY